MPIEFDGRLNEYNLVHGARRHHAIIRYCPWCGGAAPRSKRERLFAHLDDAEISRLHTLTKTLKTVGQVVKTLGKPERDLDNGITSGDPKKDGQPGRTEVFRTLEYSGKSTVAHILVAVTPNGRVASIAFVPKYLGTARKRGT